MIRSSHLFRTRAESCSLLRAYAEVDDFGEPIGEVTRHRIEAIAQPLGVDREDSPEGVLPENRMRFWLTTDIEVSVVPGDLLLCRDREYLVTRAEVWRGCFQQLDAIEQERSVNWED